MSTKTKRLDPRRNIEGEPRNKFYVKFTPERQNIWLRKYYITHRIADANDTTGIAYNTYLKHMHKDPKFKALKEALDVRDAEVTRDKLRDSSHGYSIPEIREEQELLPDPANPPQYIPDPNPKHAGKFIIDPAHPGKMHMVVTKRTITQRHFAPNSSSLIFKLCNEQSDLYKNVNHLDIKEKLDATTTERVITSVDDESIAAIAKAVVKAKTTVRE